MSNGDLSAKGSRAKIYGAALGLFARNGASTISVSDLAEAAGIARGTIYNHIESPENLLGDIAASLSTEMVARVEATIADIEDPVERLALGIRLFVRRAHEEPDWGRFLVRFALGNSLLRALMHEPPARDIRKAIEAGRLTADPSQTPVLVSMLTGATLAAMNAVIAGDLTWREAGAGTAELLLRAGGLPAAQARRIARIDLPTLAPAPAARKAKRGTP